MFPDADADAELEVLVEGTFTSERSVAVSGSELVVRSASRSVRTYVESLERDAPELAAKRVTVDQQVSASLVDLARRAIAAPPPKDDGRRGRDGARITVHARGHGRIVYLTADHDDASERDRRVAELLAALARCAGVPLD